MAGWRCHRCGEENDAGHRFCSHCGAPHEAFSAPPAEAQSEPDRFEERRLVTALFADLSGFTSLAERLDPEQLFEVVDPLIARLAAIVHEYGGRVEKYAGDAVVALFGAPTNHGDDADRALMAALDMHRAVPTAMLDLPGDAEALSVHVGVNSGHAVARTLEREAVLDYAVLGEAVILAQRLQSAAPAGETYVGEATYRLTTDSFEFESLGELTVKGKELPVAAWRLIGRRTAPSAIRHAGRQTRRFVGRKRELRLLGETIERVRKGLGGACVVLGDPGVGKSRLTQEAERRAVADGVRWVTGRCLWYGASISYRPYLDVLGQLLGFSLDDPDERKEEALDRALDVLSDGSEGHRPYLARLLGLPSMETADVDPQAFQQRLHRAVAALVASLARERPLTLAVEDVHWIDAPSLALTTDLVSLVQESPVLVYLTARHEARSDLAGVLAPGGPERQLLELSGLDPTSVTSLIGDVLGTDAPAAFNAALLDRSGGNPFFVEELLRSLPASAGTGLDPSDLDHLPLTIEDVLSSRIDRLPRPTAVVLQMASVIGRRVPKSLLRALVGDSRGTEATVGELIEAGFLDPSDEEDNVVFHHALVQEVAYGRLLRRQRRELHRRVATAAEALYGASDDSIALLARHLYLGGGGDKAVDYLIRAAEVARALFANEEAILHLRWAAELAEATPRRPEVLLTLADLLDLRGSYDDAYDAYDRLRAATGDARAWRGMASTLRKRGRHAEALDLLDDAGDVLGPDDSGRGLIEFERGRALLGAGCPRDAIPALEAALDQLGDDQLEAGHARLHLARAELQCGGRTAALEHGLQAVQYLEARNDARGLALALGVLGAVYRRLDRLGDAAEALRRGVELADRVGSVEELGACLINLGVVEEQQGHIESAIDCDRQAIAEFERVGHLPGQANGYANLAYKLERAGRYAEAAGYARRARDLALELKDSLRVADITRTEANIARGAGEPELAASLAEEAATLFAQLGAGPEVVDALELAATAWAEAGRPEQAAAARDRASQVDQ